MFPFTFVIHFHDSPSSWQQPLYYLFIFPHFLYGYGSFSASSTQSNFHPQEVVIVNVKK